MSDKDIKNDKAVSGKGGPAVPGKEGTEPTAARDSSKAASGLITAEHVNRFQRRAAFHSYISYGVIFLVFVLFGFAGYIFLFAQDIDKSTTSLELFQEIEIAKNNQSDMVDDIQKEVDVIKRQFDTGYQPRESLARFELQLIDAQTQLNLLNEKERLMLEVGYFAPIDVVKSKEELTVQKRGAIDYEKKAKEILDLLEGQMQGGNTQFEQLVQPRRVSSEAKLKRELIEQKLKVAPSAKEIKVASTNVDTLDLARTSLIRFGGVAVTLFLISVLVPIYRYNVRLAAFYLARADTLLLSKDTKVDNFAEMTNLLTPMHAFEKEPQTPIDSVSNFIKDAAGIAKKASG
jgi:hypothetical protein